MFFTYIIQNPEGKLYKGFTSDLQQRVSQHNAHDGFRSYTHKKGPWKLVYSEQFATEQEAREREKFFKSGKGRAFLKLILGRPSA